ncbi:MAG TPA: hypothetical protein PKE30_05790 [Niabella sp.]|nr:hypothetical protein [Niabella sp.]
MKACFFVLMQILFVFVAGSQNIIHDDFENNSAANWNLHSKQINGFKGQSSKGYLVTLDKSISHSANTSIKIERKDLGKRATFGSFWQNVEGDFKGKKNSTIDIYEIRGF